RSERTAPPRDSQQANRLHPAVIWSAALIVVAAAAVAAWLAMRGSALAVSPETETAADAAPPATTVEKPAQSRRSVRPQAAVRPVSTPEGAIEASTSETIAEAVNEAPASLTETEPASIEPVSDPIVAAIAALPEDDFVYSTEATGIIAPRLTSLGFVHRLVGGVRVRPGPIELVVSKRGTVERAKIFSTPSHWEDALLLSRAKTFQFVPASRDGSPVRYRFMMNVDTSP